MKIARNKEKIDFEKDVEEIFEIEVFPRGWEPVVVQYGIAPFGQSTAAKKFCWRVKGTDPVFSLPLQEFYEMVTEDESYEAHFEKILEMFGDDFRKWVRLGLNEPWVQFYKKQFGKFIHIF